MNSNCALWIASLYAKKIANHWKPNSWRYFSYSALQRFASVFESLSKQMASQCCPLVSTSPIVFTWETGPLIKQNDLCKKALCVPTKINWQPTESCKNWNLLKNDWHNSFWRFFKTFLLALRHKTTIFIRILVARPFQKANSCRYSYRLHGVSVGSTSWRLRARNSVGGCYEFTSLVIEASRPSNYADPNV